MLHSSYNINRLGSPIAGDLIGPSIFDGVGGSANYFGTSPPLNLYDPNLSSLPQLPQRRYSIGGLPSASMTEYLNLMQQNAEAAHLSNLLNETKTSITRSSQILSQGEGISGDIMLSAAAGDVIADLAKKQRAATNIDITGANILNQMPIATNSFSSHPNIYYSQPNYTNSQMQTDFLSHYKKPLINYHQSYSRPFHSTTTYTNPYYNSTTISTLPYNNYQASYHNQLHQQQQQPYHQQHHQQHLYNKYNQPPPPYSSTLSSYHRPLHYTSNPAISQSSSNYYLKHHLLNSNKLATNNANTISTSASYLQHQNQHPFSGYSNQHFDLHHLNSNNCYSKLDLDYTKQGEQAKRQVSFNIDVDTLSIDS